MTILRDRNLAGVHPDLVAVVQRAAELYPQNFYVIEGVRSKEKQRQYVASGASTTMNSRHLTGHAVDLVPERDGEPVWDWPLIYVLADCVRQASVELDVELTWGGVWDRPMHALTPGELENDQSQYVARRRAMGRKAFADGPHFELSWAAYPS